jgi:hypothetical protein
MILFLVFFVLPIMLQNVNKDYIIFMFFCNFVAKSDQKPNTKNGMNETNDMTILWNLKYFTSDKNYQPTKVQNFNIAPEYLLETTEMVESERSDHLDAEHASYHA